MNQMSDSEKSELILKTKVFYFNRCVTLITLLAREAVASLSWVSVTGHNISLEGVQAGFTADLNCFPVQSGNECNQTTGTEHGEMRVLTFAELKSLIEQGRTDNIPNNKIIPDTLNVSLFLQIVHDMLSLTPRITPGRPSERVGCTVEEKALGSHKSIVIHMVDRPFAAGISHTYDNVII